MSPSNHQFKEVQMEFNSRRSPVIGRGGMVAASHPLAVAAGLEILRRGGNAADAAVATAAALNVVEPTFTGIGGDVFALYYDASTRRVSALNGSGRAPAALTIERLEREGLIGPEKRELPPYHPYTITVPGACAAWCDLVEMHGRLSIGEALAPSIRMAAEGFPVSPIVAFFWERGVANQLHTAPGGRELTIEGRAPRTGEIFRNQGLARTFERVAQGGKEAFYRGEIAAAIAAVVKEAGGCLTEEDLAEHSSDWEQPLGVTYRDLRVWECPPNGQGLAALLALNILEGFELQGQDPLSPQRLHLLIEAMRLAFADARWYVADPRSNPAPLDELLSKEYAAERRKLIDPRRATLDQKRGVPVSASGTVYFCTVDSEGNACSFINSNYMGFGTGIVPYGWGFTLQNRGHNFDLNPGRPNSLEPGKRPYHTIIPGMITRINNDPGSAGQGDELFGPFGVMGGFMQPQGHMQVVIAMAEDGLDPQSALDRLRFCIRDGTAGGRVALEEGIPEETLQALEDMGHPVERIGGHLRILFGRGQVIYREPETGVLWGGSDPRGDGLAMCLLE